MVTFIQLHAKVTTTPTTTSCYLSLLVVNPPPRAPIPAKAKPYLG